jgi:glycosyltransferase involved in cell wall biosynthesis
MRKKVFILADWFSPGYKAGGLVTALANLTEALDDRFELFVMTRDRDLGDSAAYPEIVASEWRGDPRTNIFYTADFSMANLRRQIERVRPDVVYLNSFFSLISVKALLLRKFGLTVKVPFVLAPRGELSPGALSLKPGRKATYSEFALRGGLCAGVYWHASSDLEAREIGAFLESHGQKRATIFSASDIPPAGWSAPAIGNARRPKSGATRFVFVSRISPKKNLLFALEVLRAVSGEVELNVYGPIDDATYWADCERASRALPANVSVHYRGAVAPADIATILREHDFFLLPTLGENFGYAILEALAQGCPALISNATPWNDLAAQCAGWAIPLRERSEWIRAIDQCVAMDSETHAKMSVRAREYVQAWLSRINPVSETIEMFEFVLTQSKPAPDHTGADRSRHEEPAYADPARETGK